MSQCTARVVSTGQTAGVTGEEQQRQQQQQGVQAGQKAVQVTLQLSSPVGQISSFDAQSTGATPTDPMQQEQQQQRQQGQLKLAEASDLPQTQREMAREGETGNRAIQMSGQNNVELWLNTENAQPGQYRFTLRGEQGSCQGQIQVAGGR